MKLGIVCALIPEARTLGLKGAPGGIECLGDAVVAVCSGMDIAGIRACVDDMLEQDVKGLLNWGFAGALNPSLKAGAVLLPETIASASGEHFQTSVGLRALITEVCRGYHEGLPAGGPLYCAAAVVTDTEEKQRLFATTGADAVDMESAGIAAIAAERKLPFAAVKTVLDTATTALPGFLASSVDNYGRPRFFPFLRGLARQPASVGVLFGLARQSRAASLSLRRLATLLPEIGAAGGR